MSEQSNVNMLVKRNMLLWSQYGHVLTWLTYYVDSEALHKSISQILLGEVFV